MSLKHPGLRAGSGRFYVPSQNHLVRRDFKIIKSNPTSPCREQFDHEGKKDDFSPKDKGTKRDE